MKQNLQLRISQNLALTPQLQQSIRLLQLSSLELDQELETILQDNPLLELVDSDNADADSDADIDIAPEHNLQETNGVDHDPVAADGTDSGENNDFENDAFSNIDYQEIASTSKSVAEKSSFASSDFSSLASVDVLDISW